MAFKSHAIQAAFECGGNGNSEQMSERRVKNNGDNRPTCVISGKMFQKQWQVASDDGGMLSLFSWALFTQALGIWLC